VFSSGVPEIDKRLLYTDLATAQKLLNTQKVSSLGVFLSRMAQTAPMQARLASAHPLLAVQTWEDWPSFTRPCATCTTVFLARSGLIIAVIVVFVVTNAMAMAIIERTREIGTLRALGTLPSQLLQTLSLGGMVLGGVGALVGTLLALAVSVLLLVVPMEMPPPPGQTKGYPLLVTFDAIMYLITMGSMVLLTVLASVWVARKTVHMPVVEALSHT
jgi:putative ABC transport system permease protein